MAGKLALGYSGPLTVSRISAVTRPLPCGALENVSESAFRLIATQGNSLVFLVFYYFVLRSGAASSAKDGCVVDDYVCIFVGVDAIATSSDGDRVGAIKKTYVLVPTLATQNSSYVPLFSPLLTARLSVWLRRGSW